MLLTELMTKPAYLFKISKDGAQKSFLVLGDAHLETLLSVFIYLRLNIVNLLLSPILSI